MKVPKKPVTGTTWQLGRTQNESNSQWSSVKELRERERKQNPFPKACLLIINSILVFSSHQIWHSFFPGGDEMKILKTKAWEKGMWFGGSTSFLGLRSALIVTSRLRKRRSLANTSREKCGCFDGSKSRETWACFVRHLRHPHPLAFCSIFNLWLSLIPGHH